MSKCVIVGAGDVCPGDLSFEKNDGDLLIAADAGYRYLEKAGIVPDLLIGDFDSTDRPDFAGETVVLPVMKDDTDVGYAIKEGLRRGYKEFMIFGSLGGKRTSHTLANIQLLSFLRARGAFGTLICGMTRMFIIDGTFRFDENASGDLSLFALGDAASVTICGTKYDVEKATLARTFPLGVSNSFTGRVGCITVHSGEVLCVIEKE